MLRGPCTNLDSAVLCRAKRIHAGLQPFKTDERKPSVRRGEFVFTLSAPGVELLPPLRIPRTGCRRSGGLGQCRGDGQMANAEAQQERENKCLVLKPFQRSIRREGGLPLLCAVN